MENQESNQLPPPQKKFTPLQIAEFGAAEIVFATIVLLGIFATLNFFGILPVSKTIPFLSFLPTQGANQPSTPLPGELRSGGANQPPTEQGLERINNTFALLECSTGQKSIPITQEVHKRGANFAGTIKGAVSRVALSETGKTLGFWLTGIAQETDLYKFDLHDKGTVQVVDTQNQPLTFADFSVGQELTLTFECVPERTNLAKITKVSIREN